MNQSIKILVQHKEMKDGTVTITVGRVQKVNEGKKKLQLENTELKRELTVKYKITNIIGNSSRMQEVFEMIHRVADSNATKKEIAEGGTLFLDEIGELSHSVQEKLLHVVQEREFKRLGSNRSIKCDVHLVVVTNRDLEK